MQTTMNFIAHPDGVNEPFFATGKDIKISLLDHIKKVGLVGFKDYFMSVKLAKNNNIPTGIEREHFLEIIRDVYVTRAKGLENRNLKKAA